MAKRVSQNYENHDPTPYSCSNATLVPHSRLKRDRLRAPVLVPDPLLLLPPLLPMLLQLLLLASTHPFVAHLESTRRCHIRRCSIVCWCDVFCWRIRIRRVRREGIVVSIRRCRLGHMSPKKSWIKKLMKVRSD